MSELTQLLAVIMFIGIIVWIIINGYSLKLDITETPVMEGMENKKTSSGGVARGVAGGSADYAAKIKAEVIQLQDTLLITKYRIDYENAIIGLDDLINFLMLKETLNMNIDGGKSTMTGLNNLITLKNAKEALNVTMAFVDKQ
jgi:hypothetical protein